MVTCCRHTYAQCIGTINDAASHHSRCAARLLYDGSHTEAYSSSDGVLVPFTRSWGLLIGLYLIRYNILTTFLNYRLHEVLFATCFVLATALGEKIYLSC